MAGLFLVIEGFVGCNKVLGVVMITLSLGLLGICAGGYQANHLDIAPLYAGECGCPGVYRLSASVQDDETGKIKRAGRKVTFQHSSQVKEMLNLDLHKSVFVLQGR